MLSERPFTTFEDPPWRAPLDVQSVLRSVPADATIAGMFLEPMAAGARAIGKPLPSARERYTRFHFYPLEEHVRVLTEAAEVLFPEHSMREALRRLGRAAPKVMFESTVGRVTMGAAEGAPDVLRAMAKVFSVYLRPSNVEVVQAQEGRVVVRLENVGFFVDSHHVGVYEGVLRQAGVDGRVQVCVHNSTTAEMLCTW